MDQLQLSNLSTYVRHHYTPLSCPGLTRYHYVHPAVGYVFSGRKIFHTSEGRIFVEAGEVFHVSPGEYEVENEIISSASHFHQVLFFYAREGMRRAFLSEPLVERARGMCFGCCHSGSVYHYPGWPALHRFFEHTERASSVLSGDSILSHLKLCELVHLLLSHPGCCVSRPLSQVYFEDRL